MTACAFPDGVIHDHGNDQCHEASRKAGAVDALREAAAEWASEYGRTTREHPKSAKIRAALRMASALADDRADQLARNEVTS